ncbi:MAG TPA: methyltransferase domain-containing protein [Candidatus Eisenbacteria bacterium]|jgi:SAM-dependent methyltransferase
MASDSRYVHGTAPEEQRRLSTLNELLNESSLRGLGLQGGERVLDVGAGLGQLTRAIARAVGPQGRALGIERSAEQIAEARRLARADGEERLLEMREGDVMALELAPGEWGSFDVAHARFILEHVPDPKRVVQAMARAVRIGGRVVLEDDDHDVLRLSPEPPGLMDAWRAYIRSYERNGNDPYVGRKLVALLHAAGVAPSRNAWLFFGGCAGDGRLELFVQNLAAILEGARAAILAAGPIERDAFDATIAAIHAWGARPDAAIWFARCWAEGVRRV